MTITKIPNQIIKEALTPLTLSKVDAIALHHMAGEGDVKAIEAAHINQGWRAIGYNYWIDYDGTVYEGRGLHVGAGVENQNGHIVSIGFRGDYHSAPKTMPDAQFNAGVELILWLKAQIPTIRTVGGHKDFMATACPGQYFPLKELQTLKLREEEQEMIYNYIDGNMPQWARPTIQKLLNKGYLKGNEQGELELNDTMLKIFVVNDRAGLYGE